MVLLLVKEQSLPFALNQVEKEDLKQEPKAEVESLKDADLNFFSCFNGCAPTGLKVIWSHGHASTVVCKN